MYEYAWEDNRIPDIRQFTCVFYDIADITYGRQDTNYNHWY